MIDRIDTSQPESLARWVAAMERLNQSADDLAEDRRERETDAPARAGNVCILQDSQGSEAAADLRNDFA